MTTKTITIEIDDTLRHALLIAKADYLHDNLHCTAEKWRYVHGNVQALNVLYDQIANALREEG